MSSKFSNKYPIPEKFPEILHDFSREVLRYMPKDILDFAIQYFYSLETSNPLNYIEGGSKTIPRITESVSFEKKEQLKDKRQDISTPSITTNQNTQNFFFKQGEQSDKKYEDEKEDIKEVRETNSSKMNSRVHSEESRPESQQSHGSGIVRASKIFVNNIFESSQQKVRESLNLYGKEVKEKTENENIYNLSGHTFSDISGNSEDKNAVRHFVGDIFDESKKNAN
jgi:hypothetical protein